MKKPLTILTLLLAVLFSTPIIHAAPKNHQVNTAAISEYKKGQIIAYFDKEGSLVGESQARYYRKYLGTTPEGYFLIQDFYTGSNKKQNDPIAIKSESDFAAWWPTTTDGKHILWYENGQKREAGQYKNGTKEGTWNSWYENGQKKQEAHYINGKAEGFWVQWYKNGQKYAELNFKEGSPHGLLVFWHENGQKQSEGRFKNGEPIGKWIFWDEEGKKRLVDAQTIKEEYFNDHDDEKCPL